MRAFGKSTPRGNPELGRVMRRYPDELPGPVSAFREKPDCLFTDGGLDAVEVLLRRLEQETQGRC